MSVLKKLFGRGSVPPPTTLKGEATIRSEATTPSTVITVGLRLVQDRRRCLGAKLEEPFLAELTAELAQFYKSKKFSTTQRNLIRTFDGYAIDGVARAYRSLDKPAETRLRALSVVFTKFEGMELRVGWGQGVILATALACLHALGEPQRMNNLGAEGWEET